MKRCENTPATLYTATMVLAQLGLLALCGGMMLERADITLLSQAAAWTGVTLCALVLVLAIILFRVDRRYCRLKAGQELIPEQYRKVISYTTWAVIIALFVGVFISFQYDNGRI